MELDAAALLAALLYGLLGSFHCVLMCGPLAILPAAVQEVDHRRRRLVVLQDRLAPPLAYQLTRTLGYAALGAIFGSLGASLNLHSGRLVHWLVPAALASTLLVVAFGRSTALGRGLARLAARTNRPLWGAALGAATPLLPCGFLYSMAPLAAATGSPTFGAALLVAFAVGTMPALLGAALPWRFLQQRLGPRSQTILRTTACILAATLILLRAVLVESPGDARGDDPVCHRLVTGVTQR